MVERNLSIYQETPSAKTSLGLIVTKKDKRKCRLKKEISICVELIGMPMEWKL